MIILGITAFQHDSAACVLLDGRLVAAAEEERFTRKKHDGGFPYGAINYCLSEIGASINDVAWVGFCFNPWLNIHRKMFHLARHFPKSLAFVRDRAGYSSGIPSMMVAKSYLKRLPGYDPQQARFKFQFVEHHIAHAHSCFTISPFDRAAILSADGIGEWTTTLLASGRGTRISKFKKIYFPASLGKFYATLTMFLGFRPNSDEHEVMALSSYAKTDKYYSEFKRVIRLLPDGEYEMDTSFLKYQHGQIPYYSDKFLLTFGADRKPGQEITDRHAEVAGGGQRRLEDAMVHIANYLHKVTGSRKLCLSGGVALNCVANGKLLRQTKFEEIYVQPAAYDAGAAIGAAFYIHNGILGNRRDFVMDHAFWGPEYSHDEIEAFLRLSKVTYREVKDPSAEAARLVSKGRIVGWFQGRMEFGPHALGKRSILADPRDPKMKDVVNEVIQHRESFSPFAASILAEKVSEYFDFSHPSPFKLLVYNVLPEKRDVIPSVTHVDGTSCIHSVEKDTDPLYYNLITEFERLTGVPIVLNTSFSIEEEPIVCTPKNALRCFYTTGIDDLVIGDFLLSKIEGRE